jgi:hypothetical protein
MAHFPVTSGLPVPPACFAVALPIFAPKANYLGHLGQGMNSRDHGSSEGPSVRPGGRVVMRF